MPTAHNAFISGAGKNIGRAIALDLARRGCNVLINGSSNRANCEAVAAQAKALGVEAAVLMGDVGAADDAKRLAVAALEQFGTIDILVNNAWGGGKISRVELKTDALIEHGLAVGFRGPLWAMQKAFPIMKEKGYGRVINICSLNGVNAHMGTLEYNSAKEALRALTRTAAREWASTGVVCNVICPAAKSATFKVVMAEHPELVAAADASNPMGYIGDPYQDIAPVALFLAGEDSRYVTGNTLFVDGGSHINGSHWAPELSDEP
jgi:NAD(P)-dependent dehydrogenase (short-subunit alcohol dehydrogenase family)